MHGTPIDGIRTTNQATTETEQARKVVEEAVELLRAVADGEGRGRCLEEAIDVIKAASKFVADRYDSEEVSEAFRANDSKNMERGYCD